MGGGGGGGGVRGGGREIGPPGRSKKKVESLNNICLLKYLSSQASPTLALFCGLQNEIIYLLKT